MFTEVRQVFGQVPNEASAIYRMPKHWRGWGRRLYSHQLPVIVTGIGLFH